MTNRDYQAGYESRCNFQGADVCPHKSGPRRDQWLAGWNAADDAETAETEAAIERRMRVR